MCTEMLLGLYVIWEKGMSEWEDMREFQNNPQRIGHFSYHDKWCGLIVIKFSQVSTSCPDWRPSWKVRHSVLTTGCLGNHQWGTPSPELQYFEAELDWRFTAAFSILTISNFVFPPTKQSPYCHLSSHIVLYALGEAGEPSSPGNGCAITALSLKVITHISRLFFTVAAEPMGEDDNGQVCRDAALSHK